MPTFRSPRQRTPRLSVSGSLLAVVVASGALTVAYAGCFLPDYAKEGSDAATNGTPGASSGNPGAGGAGAGGSGPGGSGGGGGVQIQCEVPDEAPSEGSCVMPTTGAGGGGGTGGGAGGAGGNGGAGGTAGSSGDGGAAPTFNNACNPVTNEPCDAGEACDVIVENEGPLTGEVVGFQCYPDGNTAELCEECNANPDDGELVFCVGGLSCIGGGCFRYCCSDLDCGDGKCLELEHLAAPSLGACVAK